MSVRGMMRAPHFGNSAGCLRHAELLASLPLEDLQGTLPAASSRTPRLTGRNNKIHDGAAACVVPYPGPLVLRNAP